MAIVAVSRYSTESNSGAPTRYIEHPGGYSVGEPRERPVRLVVWFDANSCFAGGWFLKENRQVLILGATGFVGKRLVTALSEQRIAVRALIRDRAKVNGLWSGNANVELIEGDLLEPASLRDALHGVDIAYYLVHSMGGTSLFSNLEYAEKDKRAARNFTTAAEASGLKRVIYLGALGEAAEDLSEHLHSRAQVAQILTSANGTSATILRAAIIIGAGGASFEMLRYLVERLPVMGCPRWIDTRIQPIAIRDVLAYLAGCLAHPETAGQTYDIGGPEVMTYREMMQAYARARGLLPRLIFRVPLLTPLLSAYWVDLVTPVPSGVAHPLIEGMKNEVVCREDRIRNIIPIEPTPFAEAVRTAVSEETSGPGVRGC